MAELETSKSPEENNTARQRETEPCMRGDRGKAQRLPHSGARNRPTFSALSLAPETGSATRRRFQKAHTMQPPRNPNFKGMLLEELNWEREPSRVMRGGRLFRKTAKSPRVVKSQTRFCRARHFYYCSDCEIQEDKHVDYISA